MKSFSKSSKKNTSSFKSSSSNSFQQMKGNEVLKEKKNIASKTQKNEKQNTIEPIKRPRKTVFRPIMKSNFKIHWNSISNETRTYIIENIKSTIQNFLKSLPPEILNPHKPKKERKKKNLKTEDQKASSSNSKNTESSTNKSKEKKSKDKKTKEKIKEKTKKGKKSKKNKVKFEFPKHHAPSLVLGINEVTKLMEQGKLRLAVVARDVEPDILINHLPTLSFTKKIPLCSLSDSSVILGNLFGLKSIIAFGFKNLENQETDPFNDLIEKIIEKTPKIYLPWLTSEDKYNSKLKLVPSVPLESSTSQEREGNMKGSKRKNQGKKRTFSKTFGTSNDSVVEKRQRTN